MSKTSGLSQIDRINSGQVDIGHNNVSSAGSVVAADTSGLLAIGGDAGQAFQVDIGAATSIANADSLFEPMNKGGGALGQSVTKNFEEMTDHMVTPHGKGDQGMQLQNLGSGERANSNVEGLSQQAGIAKGGVGASNYGARGE